MGKEIIHQILLCQGDTLQCGKNIDTDSDGRRKTKFTLHPYEVTCPLCIHFREKRLAREEKRKRNA
jgi:hypothetical protein